MSGCHGCQSCTDIPDHLPIPVTATGEGPEFDNPVGIVCWCGDSGCEAVIDPAVGWGEDPNKYVLEKGAISGKWAVWPPQDGDPIYFSSFNKAREWLIWRTMSND